MNVDHSKYWTYLALLMLVPIILLSFGENTIHRFMSMLFSVLVIVLLAVLYYDLCGSIVSERPLDYEGSSEAI